MGSTMSQEEIAAMMSDLSAETGNGDGDGASAPAETAEAVQPAESAPPEEYSGYIPDDTELGILGEIYNISMGAAATAVSSLLSMKVDITAPVVEIVAGERLIYQPFEPAVGVEIKYIEGIEGVNVFILSQLDVMKIVDIMLGGTGVVDETAEFNDMHISAIGEVMNQMMGQSSMSLANFLDTQIDISVPETYKIEGDYNPANQNLTGTIIATRFKFIVGDIINSEMLTTCSMNFAENMIEMAKKAFGLSDGGGNAKVQNIIEKTGQENAPAPAAQPQAQPQQQAPAPQQPQPQQQMPPPGMGMEQQPQMQMQPQMMMAPYPQQQYQQPYYQPPMQQVSMQSAQFQSFDSMGGYGGPDAENNPKLRNVPVDVTVEIGKTSKKVSEILEYGEGSVIELDNQSSDPVAIYVNGVLFARGSVIVIEENFGVKITEIL